MPGSQVPLYLCGAQMQAYYSLGPVYDNAGPIHLVVTDVIMPRMMGSEVAARITALRPSIKVLYISGYPGDAIVKQGVPAARDRCLRPRSSKRRRHRRWNQTPNQSASA